MDEASQSSFYEDDQSLTEVPSHLKPDGGVLTFNSLYQQLEDGTVNSRTEKFSNNECDFTVPVCEEQKEQKCQLAKLRNPKGMDNSTSMSQVPSVENQTGPSTGLAGEKPLITCNLEDMRHNSPEFSTECEIRLSPPCKRPRLHDDSCEFSIKDGAGKSGTTQCELYLDWNAHGHFESELVNKVPAGWPAIGVKSIVKENKAISQKSTLSFFALVEQAHLLSEEQLQEIKKLEHVGHPDQCRRPTLKRNSSSHETSVSRAEKFAKIGDGEEDNSSEDHEFYLQEETSKNCSDGLNVYADQEVPSEEVNSDFSRQAVEKDATLQAHGNSDNLTSKVFHFGIPTVNDKNNNFSWQCSTDFRKASSRDEPNNGGSCSESFCSKFDEKNKMGLTDGLGEFPAAAESTDQARGVLSTDDDRPQMSSGPSEKPQTVIIINEHVVPHIACKYPLLPQKMTNEAELCSSLRTIDERDLIDDQCPNDVDGSCLQPRNESLTRDASSLYNKEDVQELLNNDITKRLQGPECLNSSGLNFSKPASHIERFDKVKFECLENKAEDCSIDEQPVSLEHKVAPGSINKENKENAEEHTPFTVAAESMNGHLQDAHNFREETQTDSIQSKGTTNEKTLEMVSNFAAQENRSNVKKNIQKINVTASTEQQASDDDKENKREFGEEYGHQRNKASHSGIEDEKETNINCHHTESNSFRTQIASGMLDLDGPELLQFAMMFVQGAMKKSQTTVLSCDDPLQCEKETKEKSGTVPAFSWKRKLTYHSQHAPLEPSDDEKSSIASGSSLIDESGEHTDGDNNEGPHLVRPLSNTSCNRPFRLGLSRKQSNKPLHPYLKKQPQS